MIKEIEVDGVKHGVTLADEAVGQGLKKDKNGTISVDVNDLGVLTEEKLLAGDTLTKDPESGNIEIITGAQVIEKDTPFVPFAKGKGKKLGVALSDGFMNESGSLGLKLGTLSRSENFVPICIGSCFGYHGGGYYFGIALGSSLKCNSNNALELVVSSNSNSGGTGSGTSCDLMIGSTLKILDGKLEICISSKSAMGLAVDGLSLKVGTEFDIPELGNSLLINLATGVNEKTRYGFGLCVDRKEGLALSLAPGTNPLKVNEIGELYIDMTIIKELLDV